MSEQKTSFNGSEQQLNDILSSEVLIINGKDFIAKEKVIDIADKWSKKMLEENNPYKTACEGINPDNPMAVIEFLPNLLEDVNSLIQSDNFCKDYPATSRSLLKLLTKLQSK